MPLTHDLAPFFAPLIQTRGRAYARDGRVQIEEAGPDLVRATVRGAPTWRGPTSYDVLARRTGDRLEVHCECPYYDGGDYCKHIWAVLSVAERAGYLGGEDPARPLRTLNPAAKPEVDASTRRGSGSSRARSVSPQPEKIESWRRRLGALQRDARQASEADGLSWPPGRVLHYLVDASETFREQNLVLRVLTTEVRPAADPPPEDPAPRIRNRPVRAATARQARPARVARAVIPILPDAGDREILGLLSGVEDHEEPIWTSHGRWDPHLDEIPNRFRLRSPFSMLILPLLCRTGRCSITSGHEVPPIPLAWDEGEPFTLTGEVRAAADGSKYEFQVKVQRGEEILDRDSLLLAATDGLLFLRGRVVRLLDPGWSAWMPLVTNPRPVEVPAAARDEFLMELLQTPHLPPLDLPEDLRFEEVRPEPRPHLRIRPVEESGAGRTRFEGDLSFDYAGSLIVPSDGRRAVFDPAVRRLVVRSPEREITARRELLEAGFRHRPSRYPGERERLTLSSRRLFAAVRTLLSAGWHVEAQGKVYRRPGGARIEVTGSGIDWFELRGDLDFDGEAIPFPKLLAAMKRGEEFITLSDGSLGLIPEEWARKYQVLAAVGEDRREHLRFRPSQVGLLDALLGAHDNVIADLAFDTARGKLRAWKGVEPVTPGPGFHGTLRPYQKEGLGWLFFLRDFGFGGCLADDMGLGKTVMVLALLESRAALRRATAPNSGEPGGGDLPPTVVVVPRSLVFNWIREAARFTPDLRVLDHTGPERSESGASFKDYDVVLTTYGTLRRDALLFHDLEFDYAILDEAQAIKNAATASSKAARLVRASHRLALSGTPVENHLGELWSLFEFLNPGMLGRSSLLRLAGAGSRRPDPESLELLARGLRPFILRRTKDQVARELPPKLEQTITCELEPAQKKLYEELRAHYRASILGLVERQGIERSRIQVLEALLRLRQASCHPGLIDKSRRAESSAKLEVLLPQLEQVLEEGHKALVFSQFTSFLSIVRERVEAAGFPYEYLDGRTKNREERVQRFQTDPDCRLFLISLKAGGLGLNLTAAEYVYLLDPWWNPAVETQAIDRAHRIGQERRVFACRIIARGTVEEKVVELQHKKRALADAIVGADESLLRKLTAKDLEMLLA